MLKVVVDTASDSAYGYTVSAMLWQEVGNGHTGWLWSEWQQWTN